LACASCHLKVGTEPGTLTLLQTDEHYPRFSGRAAAMTDIEDRINECMTRSMNGKPLPMDSPEMIAMASYLRSLGAQYEAMGATSKHADEPAAFQMPDRRADVTAGETVYTERCAICHGTDGGGLLATADPRQGFLFPALWGPDSFNDGAGMGRVLTASRFIKARMPLGQPDLTDDQAFDVAAFINSKPRPAMPGLEHDYPDLTRKPIDNGYGPYADDFPQDQHKYGPFKPIADYYNSLKPPAS
jgi:thiosulfate dehydrogenase